MVNKNQDQKNAANKNANMGRKAEQTSAGKTTSDNHGNRAQGVDPKTPKKDEGRSDMNNKNIKDQHKTQADAGSGMSINQKHS